MELITLRFDVQNLECIPKEAVWDLKPDRTAGSDQLCGPTHSNQAFHPLSGLSLEQLATSWRNSFREPPHF
ncbi:hypothetical protein CRENBAI_014585 [Crenichthys baileyi]|uniref:Uncharacterized protein n=1 Tax=Crenichthys baileyi TaxID=28760 RepID=A0AAV9SHZ1_9TELE